ncbi:MAG: isoaspartyl peptidase/L-asparaginase [Xanthomonadaceae bacterium]|nr:isoaspartyl peptidase/L-asparaginase [Xanthomonadaceae bacterium]
MFVPGVLAASFSLMALPGAAQTAAPASQPVLVIHGGAGVIRRENSQHDDAAIRRVLETALRNGYAELQAGKPALDAVTAAITVLEDSPYFNAGKGAVFTHEGRNELDASVMVGNGQRAGAVAGVQRIKNPILLARAVMEKSPHVMLVGQGAESFAKSQGFTLVPTAYFHTDKRAGQLRKAQLQEAGKQVANTPEYLRYIGTVGAVALDAAGHLAAGTSTGGMTNKRWNRVGDSPIIGAGTWADGRCAFSGTGWGEFYIRTAAARTTCARVEFENESAAVAGAAVVNGDVVRLGGNGGAIVMTANGDFAFPFNTEGMYRGWIDASGQPHVALYVDEGLRGDVLPAPAGQAPAPAH